jgi:hypothetical protein
MGHVVTFENKGAVITMDIWYDNKTASIEAVSSKYKRRGLATGLMRLAIAYADMLDVETVLTVAPFGTPQRDPDAAELRAWYMTFGFNWEGDDVMSRPRKSERDTPSTERNPS